jgi:adenylate cyclase
MNLIPRSTQSSEIQALSCLLIKTILTSYEPATQPFLDIGGLKYLLDASELSSKALLANKSNKTNTNVLPRMHFDRDDLSYEVKHVEILESFRTVPIKNLSLIKGFYKKYFANGFLNELEEMSSERRKMTFTNFIDIFRKLEHLIKVNNSMKIDGGIYSTIERVLSDSKEIMQVGYVFIYKLDEENQELSQVGLDDAVKMPANVGLVGKCIQLKELLNVQNPGRHTEYFSEIDNPEGGDSTPKSLLIFPILDSDEKRVSGVLLAVNKLGPPPIFAEKNFNEEDEYMFRSLGYIFGAILGNTRVHDSMINTQKKVTVLLDTTRSLASILDLSKLIKVIMDSAKELLSSDRCTLFLHDPERKQLRAIIQGRDNVQEIRIPQNAGIAGAVFISGDPINIHDAYRDSRFNPEVDKQTGYVTRTILCMPIKNIQGECIGVTQMINKRSGVYSLEDEMILSSFSSQGILY